IDSIKVTATDTSKVPNTSATAASSGADLNGMAAKAAAETIRARMAQHLATAAGVSVDDVTFTNGEVQVGARETLSFAQAAKRAYAARISLSSTGYYATPKISWDRERGTGRPFFYFAYGAAVSEVVIDTLTGENRLLRVDILHDAGRSLNPAIDLGQVEGGFAQGAGWLTTEELSWSSDGRLLTHAPQTYKIPVASDRAPDMRLALWDKGENVEETIYRSKAVGEPPLMLGISVLMALTDAVASVGAHAVEPKLDAPATPERILMAVEDVKRRRAGAVS
ncbi:MAG: xanthine dehydrogenase molybdopterin binding subunit, partial [Pseudomonadota bacterium]